MAKISDLGYQFFSLFKSVTKLLFANFRLATHKYFSLSQVNSLKSHKASILTIVSNNAEVVYVLLLPGTLHGSWPVPGNSINICLLICTQSINLLSFPEIIFRLVLTAPIPRIQTVLIFLQMFLHLLKNAQKELFSELPWCSRYYLKQVSF